MVPGPYTVSTWYSCHIYVENGIYDSEFDWVILDFGKQLVDPLLKRRVIDYWFFARLVEGRPHLRLRLHVSRPGISPVEDVDHILQSCTDPRLRGYRWSVYEPELQRYGGPEAIGFNESFFATSSTVVQEILGDLQARQRTVRLGAAAVLMLQMSLAFTNTESQLAQIFEQYSSSYFGDSKHSELRELANHAFKDGVSPLLSHLHSVYKEPLCLGAPFDEYYTAASMLKERCDKLDSRGQLYSDPGWNFPLWSVVSSQMHMTNNRLGVSRDEECYLAYFLLLFAGALGGA